jgi:hypothetical protein
MSIRKLKTPIRHTRCEGKSKERKPVGKFPLGALGGYRQALARTDLNEL